MVWVFAVPVVGFVVFLVVGAVTGRVRMQSCCRAADPRRDARMRDAFLDGPEVTEQFSHSTAGTPDESASGRRTHPR